MVTRSAGKGSNPDPATHKALAGWAAACAERTLSLFEHDRPEDDRPRVAIETLRAWIRGEVPMSACRTAAFAAHAAARDAEQAGAVAAVAAARAAGQAAAVAHMAGHSPHVAAYAAKAVGARNPDGLLAERKWQLDNLSADIRSIVFPRGQ